MWKDQGEVLRESGLATPNLNNVDLKCVVKSNTNTNKRLQYCFIM